MVHGWASRRLHVLSFLVAPLQVAGTCLLYDFEYDVDDHGRAGGQALHPIDQTNVAGLRSEDLDEEIGRLFAVGSHGQRREPPNRRRGACRRQVVASSLQAVPRRG